MLCEVPNFGLFTRLSNRIHSRQVFDGTRGGLYSETSITSTSAGILEVVHRQVLGCPVFALSPDFCYCNAQNSKPFEKISQVCAGKWRQ